jgi:chromate reductase
MTDKRKIGVVIGSLRKEAFSRKLANYVVGLFAGTFDVNILEIGDLTPFNQDLDDEGKTPTAWTKFRGEVKEQDAIIFVTPEYNRSIPGVLKNAIDIASRPAGENSWAGKPGAIISNSPGGFGGFGANKHLSQPLNFLGLHLLEAPEQMVADVVSLFDENGNITSEHKKESFARFAKIFTEWIDRFVS